MFLVTGLTGLVYHLKQHGVTIFGLLLPVNVLIVFVSLFSLLSGIPLDGWTAGNAKGFMGLFSHQNSLGAILLFTFPGWLFLHWLMENKKVSENHSIFSILFREVNLRNFKYLLAAGIVFNVLLLALTYSRASILSLFVMLVLYVFLIFRRNVKSLAVSSVLLFLVFLSVSLITPVSLKGSFLGSSEKDVAKVQEEKIIARQDNVIWYSFWYKGDDTPYSTRQHIFADSWKAAQIGGIIGIGYGVSHPDITNNAAGSRFDQSGRYIREKGNSFLALVEETGVIGLILFFIPLLYLLIYLGRDRINTPFGKVIFFPALLSFYLHCQFESWFTGVSSPFLFIALILQVALLMETATTTKDALKGSIVP